MNQSGQLKHLIEFLKYQRLSTSHGKQSSLVPIASMRCKVTVSTEYTDSKGNKKAKLKISGMSRYQAGLLEATHVRFGANEYELKSITDLDLKGLWIAFEGECQK